MRRPDLSRREFLGTVAGTAAVAAALKDPAEAAAQAVGIKKSDLPDLTIKEVKVYVTDITGFRVINGENGQIASIVTNSGIEGNAVLRDRLWHPNVSVLGWLQQAKRSLVGRNVTNFHQLTSQWNNRYLGQSSYSVVTDTCLWDILGKAVGLPIYKILGGFRDRQLAYASSFHLQYLEEFGPDAAQAKKEGFRGYKIHPGQGQSKGGPRRAPYLGHIEEIKEVRKAVGDDFLLLFDPVGRYTREEAIKVGRVLDQYGYIAFEDPIPTKDIAGLADLAKALDVQISIGEFIFSMYDYPEYIQRGAAEIVRLILDNLGGITPSMKVGHMAETFGLECQPHNWGELMDLAAHFHVELALPNCRWFEMPYPMTAPDRPYHKDKIRIDPADGCVPAPTAPGLGYPIDPAALEKLMKRVDR